MPGRNGTPPQVPPPALHYYAKLYADEINSLAALLSDDKLEHWFVNADANADELTANPEVMHFERRQSMLNCVVHLKEASNKLRSTGIAWMDAAAQHSNQTEEAEKQKYDKLREDLQVAVLDGRALERLKNMQSAINVAVVKRKEDQCGQFRVVAEVKLQGPPTSEVRDPTAAASDQYGRSKAVAEAKLQDPSSGEVRDSADASCACYTSDYVASVQKLSATLQEIERLAPDIIGNEDIQTLKEVSKRVSSIAKKWMSGAATDPVQYQTESLKLQTMRKNLHVLSLQRQVSNKLQKLRRIREVNGQASNQEHKASTEQDQTSTNQHQANAKQHLEGFQAQPGIVNRDGSDTSGTKEQATSHRPKGFQARTEIVNPKGSETNVNQYRHLLSSIIATVVENFDEPIPDSGVSSQGTKTAEMASYSHASDSEFDYNRPSSESEASDHDAKTAEQTRGLFL